MYADKKLEELIDKNLKGCFDSDELGKAVELALQCTQSHPDLRPKMSQVLKTLEGLNGQLEPLEAPADGVDLCQGRTFSFSLNFNETCDESSFVIEAIELSGPR